MTADLITRLEAAAGPDRFWSKIDRSGGPGSCWLWAASKNHKGYGQFSVGSKVDGSYRMLRAHRVAYEMIHGPIPGGKHIDHICSNRACCNPAHLQLVTPGENNKLAGARKNACWRGHLFTPENTIEGRNGTRECRECRLERKRRYRREARIAYLEARMT